MSHYPGDAQVEITVPEGYHDPISSNEMPIRSAQRMGIWFVAIAVGWFAPMLARAQNQREIAAASTPRSPVIFEKKILPIFEASCVKCHAGSSPQAGLDVRTRAGLLKGGSSGPVIVPGAPENSLLYEYIDSGKMPMGGPKLTEKESALIRLWIQQWPPAVHPEFVATGPPRTVPGEGEHWAFQPLKRPPIPKPKNTVRLRNPLDAFVMAKLEQKELTFSPDADRITLLRRVYFDLIGLPPSPQEVDEFLADSTPNACEAVIAKLLASPRYGERWGRHWLDVAGYADSEGGEAADVIRPNAWRYRDYVIRAFNSDKPYDQFLKEQLAGDELSEYHKYDALPRHVVESLEATGFLRTAADGTQESFPQELLTDYQWQTLFDTQQIVTSSLMGLTMQCARCHDHKYEPISQKDYYRLQALFAGSVRPAEQIVSSSNRRIIEATAAEQNTANEVNGLVDPVVKALKDLKNARLAQYQAKHPKRIEASEDELRQAFPEYVATADRLAQELKEEEAKRINLPTIRALYDLDANPPPTRILQRGDYRKPGEEVQAGVPAVLEDSRHAFQIPPPRPEAKTTGHRLAFANWLTFPEHPLTARVLVNRIWAHHFGEGIVPTLDNFGKSGAAVTNQPLLDWLSSEFVRQGWSIKAIHRLIMTSTAYRQSSRARAEGLRVDPDNKLLWRMNTRRLEAEIVRDTMLAVSGTLDLKMYGEPVKNEKKPSGEIIPADDTSGGRRSIYLMVRRSAPQSFLNVFDAPVMVTNSTHRSTSTTASQALALMNSEFVSSQAEHFAGRVLKEMPPSEGQVKLADPNFVEYAFRLALARRPSPSELDMMLTFIQNQKGYYRGEDAEPLALRVHPDLCQALLSSNEFVYID